MVQDVSKRNESESRYMFFMAPARWKWSAVHVYSAFLIRPNRSLFVTFVLLLLLAQRQKSLSA